MERTLIAHRGDALRYPENTIEAVAAAYRHGFRNIEVDLQVRDGQLYLTHDETGGESIEDLARWAYQHEDARLFLDFKTAGLSALEWTPLLEKCAGLFANFVPISHHMEMLIAARHAGIAETGYVIFRTPDQTTLDHARLLGPEWVFINQIFVPLGGLPKAPWKWVVYEIEDEEQARRAIGWGAQGLETMRCKEARQWRL